MAPGAWSAYGESMRLFAVVWLLFLPPFPGQSPIPASTRANSAVAEAITHALVGQWTGVLEYRDYSEPATSNKRVQLPTWLSISAQPEGLRLAYVYDDGPSKVVTEEDSVVIDGNTGSYTVVGTNRIIQRSTVAGLDQLKDGRGILTLSGAATDNKMPAEIRTTWTIRRNLLSWLEEVRPAGTTGAFAFRHLYTFTRAEAPAARGAALP